MRARPRISDLRFAHGLSESPVWQCNGHDSQRWSWDNGYIRYTANPDYCIDIPGGDPTGDNKQLWLFECKYAVTWTLNNGRMGSERHSRPKPLSIPWMHTLLAHMFSNQNTSDSNAPSNTSMTVHTPWHKRIGSWYANQSRGVVLPRFYNRTSQNQTGRAQPTRFLHMHTANVHRYHV